METARVNIAIIGAGGVTKCFLPQLEWLATKRPSPKLNLCFISNSKKALYNAEYAINAETALRDLAVSNDFMDLPRIIEYLAASPAKVIVVDNTGSQDVANAYPAFLDRGLSIVTSSKKAFSGPFQLWQEIFAASAASGATAYLESSVGAGLPIVSTLKYLLDTGDEVTKIEGAFSGTLSYLFNSFAPANGSGSAWSASVKKAKELGFTEPDPRDDLRGYDVARKLIILARLAGLPVESINSFPVENLIPQNLQSIAEGAEFLERLHEFDGQMDELKSTAYSKGKVVRYVGSIDMASKAIKVGLEMLDSSHPIVALKGSDNMINFYTKRYGSNPLIIQGAGAGGEVTAMGLIAGIIKVASQAA